MRMISGCRRWCAKFLFPPTDPTIPPSIYFLIPSRTPRLRPLRDCSNPPYPRSPVHAKCFRKPIFSLRAFRMEQISQLCVAVVSSIGGMWGSLPTQNLDISFSAHFIQSVYTPEMIQLLLNWGHYMSHCTQYTENVRQIWFIYLFIFSFGVWGRSPLWIGPWQ